MAAKNFLVGPSGGYCPGMGKSKKQRPPSPAVVLSTEDARIQESLRLRIDRLPRAKKGRPGMERKRLWTGDPTLQHEVLDFIAQQRKNHRTRAEVCAALNVNPTMVTRLENERQASQRPQGATVAKAIAAAPAGRSVTYFIESDVVKHGISGLKVQEAIAIIDHLITRGIIKPGRAGR